MLDTIARHGAARSRRDRHRRHVHRLSPHRRRRRPRPRRSLRQRPRRQARHPPLRLTPTSRSTKRWRAWSSISPAGRTSSSRRRSTARCCSSTKTFPFALVEEFFKSFANKCALQHPRRPDPRPQRPPRRRGDLQGVRGGGARGEGGDRRGRAEHEGGDLNVTLIDSPVANTANIARALHASGAQLEHHADAAADRARAEKLVLPGVGSFIAAMQWLRETRHRRRDPRCRGDAARRSSASASGINSCSRCRSEMGTTRGLGLVRGEVRAVRRRAAGAADRLEPRGHEREPLFEGIGRRHAVLLRELLRGARRRRRDRVRRLQRRVHRRGAARSACSACSFIPRNRPPPDCAC